MSENENGNQDSNNYHYHHYSTSPSTRPFHHVSPPPHYCSDSSSPEMPEKEEGSSSAVDNTNSHQNQHRWQSEMANVFAEVNRLREALEEREKEIGRLQRETHKLRSVIEKSELRRIPSLSSSSCGGGHPSSAGHQKKCGVSGESCSWNQSGTVSSSLSSLDLSGEHPLPTSSQGEDQDLPQRHHKDFRTRQLIRAALGDNDFLQNLDRDQIRDMVDFMYPLSFSPGDYVIREGDPGCHLYVSAEGTLHVSQDSRNLGTLKPGVAFGELALLYNCKRTASVRAITECKVWVLERRAFRLAMMKVGMQRIKDRLQFLKSVPLLKGLDAASLTRIADCLEVERYPRGSFIIREGAAGDTFFIISEGRVQVTSSSGEDQVLRELGHGDYFGETALLKEERRSANVIAITDVQVLTLDRESFLQLIGDLSEFRAKLASAAASTSNKLQTSSSCQELNCLKQEEPTLFSFSLSSASWNHSHSHYSPPVSSSGSLSSSYSDRNSKMMLSCSLPNPVIGDVPQFIGADDDFDFTKLRLDDLEFIATLGVGGFGRVELVQISYDPNRVFALKCLPKGNIAATQQQEHVYSEKNIMLSCKSPFIARMYRTFKDQKYVYMLMEACLGGEVWTILRDRGSFDEGTTRFISACVVLAMEYLHERHIIYRDLKPENLMLANDGYVKLVDFGFSKSVPKTSKTWTFCGTPEYCAPEVILNKGHDHTVDFWALGILLFELLTGNPPWGPFAENAPSGSQTDPLATYNSILKGIDSINFTKHVSKAAISLVRRLCRQVPGERLGARSFREITSHRWWQGFDWDGVKSRRMRPPILPNLQGRTDTSNFDKFELEIEDVADDFSGWDEHF